MGPEIRISDHALRRFEERIRVRPIDWGNGRAMAVARIEAMALLDLGRVLIQGFGRDGKWNAMVLYPERGPTNAIVIRDNTMVTILSLR